MRPVALGSIIARVFTKGSDEWRVLVEQNKVSDNGSTHYYLAESAPLCLPGALIQFDAGDLLVNIAAANRNLVQSINRMLSGF